VSEEARRSFALYVETAGPGRAAARARARAGEDAATAARARWSGVVVGPAVPRARVVEALGPPDRQDQSTLGYVFPERAGYVYTFAFDARGTQRSAAYRRLAPGPELAPLPAPGPERDAYVRHLAALGATQDELTARFGEPAHDAGWWPVENLRFPNGLEVEVRHGVVEANSDPAPFQG
jgi:hypothetical protein